MIECSSKSKTSSIQALVFDLDGTLLDKECRITAETLKAIKFARQQGVKVVLASGRHHSMMRPYANQLDLDTPIICCNGGYKVDADGQFPEAPLTLDSESLNVLLKALDSDKITATIFTQNGIFATDRKAYIELLDEEIEQMPAPITYPISFYERDKGLPADAGGIVKILAYCADEERGRELREQLKDCPSLNVAVSRSGFFDITRGGVNKGNALNSLLNDWGIPADKVAAFGDGENDLEMLQLAGHSVAMVHGSEKLKAIADHMLDNRQPNAIANLIYELIQ